MTKLIGEMVVCASCGEESGVIAPDAGEGEVPPILRRELALRDYRRDPFSGLWWCDDCWTESKHAHADGGDG